MMFSVKRGRSPGASHAGWPVPVALALAALVAFPGTVRAQTGSGPTAPSPTPVREDTPVAVAGDPVAQEPVTLEEAVAHALDRNRGLAAARARADAARLGAEAESGYLFPSVQATAGALRTTDPVAAFGTRLRQARFTAADFDPAALNDPDAIADWSAGVAARWELARPDRWVARDAARSRSEAADAVLDRTREATVYRTRILFADALRAEAAVNAMDAALAAAGATRDRVARRVEEGMGTDADLLQAEAAVSDLTARRRAAVAALDDARDALGAQMGWEPGRMPAPVPPVGDPGPRRDAAGEMLPTDTPHERGGAGELVERRGDLVAGRAGVEAARAEARTLTARRLPGLDAYGMVSTHAGTLTGSREANWTVGVELSVPLFTGFSLSRGAEAARAQARALELEQHQREADARREVQSARRSVEAAADGLVAARDARDAAVEAARLLGRRYEEGMATVADLLQAQAREAALRTAVVNAEANLAMARAALDFALGAPVSSPAGTDAAPAPGS